MERAVANDFSSAFCSGCVDCARTDAAEQRLSPSLNHPHLLSSGSAALLITISSSRPSFIALPDSAQGTRDRSHRHRIQRRRRLLYPSPSKPDQARSGDPNYCHHTRVLVLPGKHAEALELNLHTVVISILSEASILSNAATITIRGQTVAC